MVPAAVIEVEPASRKLTLSVVDYFKNKEDAEWKVIPGGPQAEPGDPGRRHAEARERVKPGIKPELYRRALPAREGPFFAIGVNPKGESLPP